MTTVQHDVIATVTRIVATELGLEAETLRSDLDLRELEGADSVKMLRAIDKIERTYDIELADEDVFGVNCIKDVATVIERELGAARGEP